MVANFITALLDLRGVARVAMEVFLLRFVPGMGTVVLLIAAWPVSQFVLTLAILTLLRFLVVLRDNWGATESPRSMRSISVG